MRYKNRLVWPILLLALAAFFGACGGRNGSANRQGTAANGGGKSGGGGSGAMTCPGEADIAAAVGVPVERKTRGVGCYYETADNDSSVSILSISPGRTGQLLEEMKSAAKTYGAEVVPIDVGERGYAWGANGYGQGFAVSGDRAYMLDVVTVGDGAADQKEAVIRVLKLMIG